MKRIVLFGLMTLGLMGSAHAECMTYFIPVDGTIFAQTCCWGYDNQGNFWYECH